MEADRGRADDYYLAEGTGVARRFAATDGRVAELAPLTGDDLRAVGRRPRPGDRRSRGGGCATDAHAVRFVEVVVNGPKTWSLAAALHPEIAAAYDAAQDRAAERDHRLARRARHHPGRPARPAGAGAGRGARGGGGAALHLPGR